MISKPKSQILQTKLFKPRLTNQYIARPQLLTGMENNVKKPLTLISAPSGYGKSTLASAYLDRIRLPYAWISLALGENDLISFIEYFVAALLQIKFDFGEDTIQLLQTSEPPTPTVLITSLINNLTAIEKDYIVALDDFQNITNKDVMQFFIQVLAYPPPGFHLIIITRKDPSLPISQFRSKGILSKIGINDLSFDKNDISQLLKETFKEDIPHKLTSDLYEFTEGWIAGINLFLINYKSREQLEAGLKGEEPGELLLQKMTKEMILQQPETLQTYMLASALLSQFCADLCDAVYITEDRQAENQPHDGNYFINMVQQSSVFVITLDDDEQWFRYHHLFQDLLISILESKFSPEEIRKFHHRAATWLDAKKIYEQAIEHYIKAENYEKAISILEKFKKELLNTAQWHRLEKILYLFPGDLIDSSPILAITQCWIMILQGRFHESFQLLDNSTLLFQGLDKKIQMSNTLGEWHALSALSAFSKIENSQNFVVHSEKALNLLTKDNFFPRIYPILMKAAGLRITDNMDRAVSTISNQIEHKSGSYFNAHLWGGLNYLYWLEGDLRSMDKISGELLRLGNKYDKSEPLGLGNYFLGIARYCRNELQDAQRTLNLAFEHRFSNFGTTRNSIFIALAFTYQALGKKELAHSILDQLIQYAVEQNYIHVLQIARAAEAEIHWRDGKTNQTIEWFDRTQSIPMTQFYGFYQPWITYIKVLTSQKYGAIKQADELLAEQEELLIKGKNNQFLTDVYIYQSLIFHIEGNDKKALDRLKKSIDFAKRSGNIRSYIDAGSEFIEWIINQKIHLDDYPFYGNIQAAINDTKKLSVETELSIRELEVLTLISNQLSNEEIGSKLYISPFTVKKHITHILKKLNASSRRQATVKAREKGFLT